MILNGYITQAQTFNKLHHIPSAQPKQFDRLLIIRALACLAVIWAHSYAGHLILFGRDIGRLLYPSGFLAVFVFYIVSGYSIGMGFASGRYHLTPDSILTYYINRIIKIAPLYYFVVFVNVVLLSQNANISSGQLIQLITFTANTSNSAYAGLYPLSILSTLMQFYLLAPLFYYIVRELLKIFPTWVTTCIIFICSAVVRLVLYIHGNQDYESWGAHTYITVIGNLDLFLFGLLIAIKVVQKEAIQAVRTKINRLSRLIPALVFLWYIWGNYLTYYMTDFGQFNLVKYQIMFLLPPVTALIIGLYIYVIEFRGKGKFVHVTNPKGIFKLLFNAKQFIYALGFLSYGMYLWHYPILNFLFYRTGVDFSLQTGMYRFVSAGIITVFLSLITYIVIEYPMGKLKIHAQLGKPL